MLTDGTLPEEKIFRESWKIAWNWKRKMEEQKEKYREDEQNPFFIKFSATNITGTKQIKKGNLDLCINWPLTMMNR